MSRRPKVTSNFRLNPQIQKQAWEVVSPCSLPRGKGTAVFVPQSPSNTQANRVPVVGCGFSCSSLRWFTSTLRTLQGALQLCEGPSCRGLGCHSAPSSPGRRVLAPPRCAGCPVGVAARRRAPTAVNNGAGREEKGNLLGEAARPAGGRAREGGESSLLPRCQRDAAAAGAGEGAPRERVGQLGEAGRGQPEAGSERAPGARSRRAWPARRATGGAPREGPRSSAGCRTKSCRRCNGPAMAVSARAPSGLGKPSRWDRVGEAEGGRVRAAEGSGWQSWEVGLQSNRAPISSPVLQIPNPSFQPRPSTPQASAARAQIRLWFRGVR